MEWLKARERLIQIYKNKGITTCEIKLEGCLGQWTSAFAHLYKRSDPRCRHSFKQTVLACSRCHQAIENDKDLTEEVFKKLRP